MPKRPPRPALDLDGTVRDYWVERISRHTKDRYAGVRLAKLPEDLRVYEHLIWSSRPNVVIEIGVHHGGSALWFRDRLRTLAGYGRIGRPRYIGIDVDVARPLENLRSADPAFEKTITLVEGDVTDPGLPAHVETLLPADACCLVVDDSAHVFETTMASLVGFARFVPRKGFFVVEDSYVDDEELRFREDLPRGVLPAVREWLGTAEGRRFTARPDLAIYGISANREGILQRVAV